MRVLLVEDESSVVIGVRRALEAEGYDVDAAADGVLGLDLALTGDYDVIVLDIMLPRMNGYKVCQAIRRRGVGASIVMLSAKSGEWDIADGLDLGADDYLTKPFSTVELLARIRARTRRHDRGAEALVSGNLRLEPELRRCWRGSAEIPLTPRETRLLEVLLENLGKVVRKEDLLAQAWGEGHGGDPNVVEVYVGRLRRKVDVPFDATDIETVRGVGYRLRPPGGLR